MRKNFALAQLLLGSALPLVACADNSPHIELVETTPQSLDPSDDTRDDLVLRIRYEDADGDLGGGRLSVIDCRNGAFGLDFEIDPIANQAAVDAGIHIRGELLVTVADVDVVETAKSRPKACLTAKADPTAFCVVVQDSAENVSEPACSGPIVLVQDEG